MKFISFQYSKLNIGDTLACDIYVKASDKKLVLIFKKNTILNSEDLARISKYSEAQVLSIKEEDYLLMFGKESDALKKSLDTNGVIDTEAGYTISKNFFSSEAILEGENKLDSMIKIANEFVIDLIKNSKDARSQSLVEILKELSVNDNVFVNHSNQVAAISTMIALMVDNITIDNIVEINLIGVLHGLGLMLMSHQRNDFFDSFADTSQFKESVGKTDPETVEKVVKKHFDGHNKLTTADNIIFFQHLTLIENNIDKIRIKNLRSQNILKTIGDFKLILGLTKNTANHSNPYISAKVLAVGDRLVSLMNFYMKNPSFFECSIKEINRINQGDNPIFDQKILDKLNLMTQ